MTPQVYDSPLGSASELWRQGNYAEIAALIHDLGRDVAAASDIQPGSHVLDVGAGTGNASIPAAQAGGEVTATDVTRELLEQGEQASAASGLSIAWRQADARALPFADGAFDTVVSCIGAMFAPDHRRTAAELARVCRPGGRIVMANWTPDGAAGEFFGLLGKYAPREATPNETPLDWGEPEHVREVLGPHVDALELTRHEVVLAFAGTPRELIDHYEEHFPPVIVTMMGLDRQRWRELDQELVDFAARIDLAESGQPPRYTYEYLMVVGRRR